MNISEFFKDNRFVTGHDFNFAIGEIDKGMPTMRTRIVLCDGNSVSIQASETHYCYPRKTWHIEELKGFDVPYYEYEIGFPTFKAKEWMQFAEQPDEPTETVYGYVPVEVIQDVIDQHGGIDVAATLELMRKCDELRDTK